MISVEYRSTNLTINLLLKGIKTALTVKFDETQVSKFSLHWPFYKPWKTNLSLFKLHIGLEKKKKFQGKCHSFSRFHWYRYSQKGEKNHCFFYHESAQTLFFLKDKLYFLKVHPCSPREEKHWEEETHGWGTDIKTRVF